MQRGALGEVRCISSFLQLRVTLSPMLVYDALELELTAEEAMTDKRQAFQALPVPESEWKARARVFFVKPTRDCRSTRPFRKHHGRHY